MPGDRKHSAWVHLSRGVSASACLLRGGALDACLLSHYPFVPSAGLRDRALGPGPWPTALLVELHHLVRAALGRTMSCFRGKLTLCSGRCAWRSISISSGRSSCVWSGEPARGWPCRSPFAARSRCCATRDGDGWFDRWAGLASHYGLESILWGGLAALVAGRIAWRDSAAAGCWGRAHRLAGRDHTMSGAHRPAPGILGGFSLLALNTAIPLLTGPDRGTGLCRVLQFRPLVAVGPCRTACTCCTRR